MVWFFSASVRPEKTERGGKGKEKGGIIFWYWWVDFTHCVELPQVLSAILFNLILLILSAINKILLTRFMSLSCQATFFLSTSVSPFRSPSSSLHHPSQCPASFIMKFWDKGISLLSVLCQVKITRQKKKKKKKKDTNANIQYLTHLHTHRDSDALSIMVSPRLPSVARCCAFVFYFQSLSIKNFFTYF